LDENDRNSWKEFFKKGDTMFGKEIRYFYNKIDLNNDKIPEIFVYLLGPYFGGTGGQGAAIFKIENGNYKLTDKFTLVRIPVIVSDNMTNGWKNLIMSVSGGGVKPFYAEFI
jgi:hypothetical protein